MTVRPKPPRPGNYDGMTPEQRRQWDKDWAMSPAAQAFYDAMGHDPNRRYYACRIETDGAFRISDVLPGRYEFTAELEEPGTDWRSQEVIGRYHATIEIPESESAQSNKPLDLGQLELQMRRPLHVGDMAPLFEVKSVGGQDVRLADYRGRFVLLAFGYSGFASEVDRLKQLHQMYGTTGQLQIIGFSMFGSLDQVKATVREQDIEWPQVHLDMRTETDVTKQYGIYAFPYLLLIDPKGQIVATWLGDEELTNTVRKAIAETD
jgi:peroxiredoxin